MNAEPKSFMMGFRVGQLLQGMRGKVEPVVPAEPVAYLYNGVELPKLPYRDEEYSNTTIVYGTSTTLYFTNYPGTGYDSNLYFSGQNGNAVKAIEYALKNGIWQERERWEGERGIGHRGFIFTSYDLYHPSTGEIVLAATEPVPIYE